MDLARGRWLVLRRIAAFSGSLLSILGAQQSPENDPAVLLKADASQRASWATSWLQSHDPRQIAWGAWLARVDHQKGLVPLLTQRVVEYTSPGHILVSANDTGRHDALLAVLDALIDLGVMLPPEEARELFPEFAAQSVILLVRSADDAQQPLLDIFDHSRANWTWLAAGNVLLKYRAAGFAARLLSKFTQHMTVSVFDRGFGGGAGGGSSECGFSLRQPKTGWPPVGLYHLTQFPERIPWLTTTFLVGGPTMVYYWRLETGNYDNPPDDPGRCDDGDRDRYRAQYLAKLLEFSFPQIPLDSYPEIIIEWQSENQFRQRVLMAVEEQRDNFRRAVERLQGLGRLLMVEEAASLQPRLEIVIRDQRSDRSTRLPALLDKDETVAIRTAFSRPLY